MSDSKPQLQVAVEKPSNGLFSHFSVYHLSAELLALAVVLFYIRFNNSKLQKKITRLSTRLNDQQKEIEELRNSIASLLDDDVEAYDDIEVEEVEISPNEFVRQIFINDPPNVHTSKVRKPVIIQPKIIHYKRAVQKPKPKVVQKPKPKPKPKVVQKPKPKPKVVKSEPLEIEEVEIEEVDLDNILQEVDLDEILQEELSELD